MKPAEHYCIPPLDRVDSDEILESIRRKKYFVLHAPRQTGKTSTMLALAHWLNASGEFDCLYINVEEGQACRENVPEVVGIFLAEVAFRAAIMLRDESLGDLGRRILERVPPGTALKQFLSSWSTAAGKPVVLLVDEIDSLIGDSLISVLRQLRSGYDLRPANFPQSVILCGVRDVRDYRIRSSAEGAHVTGGSAFNVKAETLRLGDFSRSDVTTLLAQHVAETGQEFETGAVGRIWDLSRGQPWLVNALAYQACFKDKSARDRSRPICAAAIDRAKETLICKRVTHLDQLADKLREARVRRVVEPLLAGSERHEFTSRDLEYVRDLGLIARHAPVRIANPIYREVVPRELTYALQEGLNLDPRRHRTEGGALDVTTLMKRFQEFFRRHSEHWVRRFGYDEAGPQLILQAFLQRVVNSGGQIEREYGLGRRRTDLLIRWPLSDGTELTYVIECKVLLRGRSIDRVVREGMHQTETYMDLCGAESGHLIVFDMRPGKSWEERVFREDPEPGGVPVTVWGM